MKKCLILLALSVIVSLTLAEASHPLWAKTSDSLAASAKALLQAKLLDPLQKKEESRSRFSRAVSPPRARRIRILENALQADAKGHPFVPFAVDESRSYVLNTDKDDANWFKDIITGCIYPETGEVMVRRGEVYYPSSMLLGASAPMAPS